MIGHHIPPLEIVYIAFFAIEPDPLSAFQVNDHALLWAAERRGKTPGEGEIWE